MPPVIDHLNPKGTKAALAEARLKASPTEEERSAGWARDRSVFEKIEARLRALAARFDEEQIPDNIRNLFRELSTDVVKSGKNLDQGVSNSERLGNLLIQGAVIGGSQFLTVKSPRKSYLPRQTASNPISLLKAFGQWFSGVAGAERTYETIAMRYGISAATYIGLFIQLFLDILDQQRSVQIAYRAGTVLGNLIALLIFFVKPLIETRNSNSSIDTFARSIPDTPTDRLHMFANSLWEEAEKIEILLNHVKKIDEDNKPSNATHDEFIAYQGKLSQVIEYLKKIAVDTLTEEDRADIATRTLSEAERAAFVENIGTGLTWDTLTPAQRAGAFKFGPPPNRPGPKTAQPIIANAVMLTNIALSYENPELIADYVVLGCMLNIILWTSRSNPHHDGPKTTRVFVENALPSLLTVPFISSLLVSNHDQFYFDKNPSAALRSTYQMLIANLVYANVAAVILQLGVSYIIYLTQSGWRYMSTRRRAAEPPIELQGEPSVTALPALEEPYKDDKDDWEELIVMKLLGVPKLEDKEYEELQAKAREDAHTEEFAWNIEALSLLEIDHPENIPGYRN